MNTVYGTILVCEICNINLLECTPFFALPAAYTVWLFVGCGWFVIGCGCAGCAVV